MSRRRRGRAAIRIALAGIGVAVVWACESPPPPSPPPAAQAAAVPVPDPLDRFSEARVAADLEALAPALGDPIADGTVGLGYLTNELGALGVAFETLALEGVAPEPVPEADAPPARAASTSSAPRAVLATLPGRSPMLFVLLAPLPRLGDPDARAGAGGAALLLELTRVLSTRPLPYTTRVVWLTDGVRGSGAGETVPAAAALAERMASREELPRIRLLVAVAAPCEGGRGIARDLGSLRMHRETFFRVARRLGRERAFPPEAGFETAVAAHVPFRERGVRGVVALYGATAVEGEGGDAPAPAEEQGAGACAPERLASVGVVLVEGLDVIGERLAKIDRFSRAPLVTDVEEAPVAGAAVPPRAGPEEN